MANVPRPLPPAMHQKLAKVPAFPAVAMRLLSLLADEGSNFSSLAVCIGTDPVLAGGLIKRANAADQASYCELRTVFQAVTALGMDRTREIALAIATAGYAHSALKTEILRPCWRHTLACALAASEVARQCGLRPAESYTAALLHDIGLIGLLTAYPSEYEDILTAADGQPEDLLRMERERFGVDHVDAGVWLARRWTLPESIVDVIGRHHEAPAGPLDHVKVVQIACRLADLLGFGVNRPSKLPDFSDISGSLPEGTRLRLSAQLPLLRDGIAREIQLYEASGAPSPEKTVRADNPGRGAACRSQEGDPERMTTAPHPYRFTICLVSTVILLMVAAATLFIQR